jgi:hypothetical protein
LKMKHSRGSAFFRAKAGTAVLDRLASGPWSRATTGCDGIAINS